MVDELGAELLVNQSVESQVDSLASHPDRQQRPLALHRTASNALYSALDRDPCAQRCWWWWADEWMEWTLAILNPLVLGVILQAAYSYRADNPGGPAPNGIQFFVLPVSISWAFLHAIKINQIDGLDDVPGARARYRRYVTTGWVARLCCCQRTKENTDQEVQNLHRALPTLALNVHFVLLTVAVTLSWPVGGSFSYNVWRYLGMFGILLVCVFLYWFFVKLRIAVVGACKNADELESFGRLARRTIFAAIVLELIIFAKYVNWYYDTRDALNLAQQNGFPGASAVGSPTDAVGNSDIIFALCSPAVFLSFGSLWYSAAFGIDLNVGVGIQVVMIGLMFSAIAVGATWATGKMAYGDSRFENSDGTPCTPDCLLNSQFNVTNPVVCLAAFSAFTGQCRVKLLQWWAAAWLPVYVLTGRDLLHKRKFNRRLQLPDGKQYHYFICHHQGSGGNQAKILYDQLTGLGCSVWYDNAMPATERNLDGMRRGVRASATLILFLSGREETDGQPDKHGQYEGEGDLRPLPSVSFLDLGSLQRVAKKMLTHSALLVLCAGLFTRYYCHAEMAEARDADLQIVGVMEEDARHGRPKFDEERRRALTGGENGGPVHPRAEENISLLDQVCFIPRRTQVRTIRRCVHRTIAWTSWTCGVYIGARGPRNGG